MVAALLIAVLLLGLQVGSATFEPGVVPALPYASATPKPGDPGGNHSKPGDKKKKKKDDDNKSQKKSSSNDDNESSNDESDQSGSEFGDQTNANNRWETDGSNRSVDTRVTRDDSQSSDPVTRDQTPAESAPQQPESTQEEAPEEVPEDDSSPESVIPPKQELSPEKEAAYQYIRARLPRGSTTKRLRQQVANDEEDFNRDPYNTGTETEAEPQADHLVALRRLVEMDGFEDLTDEDKLRIGDMDANIYAAAQFENGSRGDRTFAEYYANGRGQSGTPLDPAYRAMRIRQENEAYRALQQEISRTLATYPSRPSSGPVDVDLSQPPLEFDAQPSPPEMPTVQSPPEVPVTRAPVEVPPISVTPHMPPAPPTESYPLPPVRPSVPPTVGVPVTPAIGTAVPPLPTAPVSPVVIPTALPGWSTPPPGPVAIPSTADPLATLRAEQTALQREAASIVARWEALQRQPGFDTNPAAVAENTLLHTLAGQVDQRQNALTTFLASPPAQLQPPPSFWQQVGSGLGKFGRGLKTVADLVFGSNEIATPSPPFGGMGLGPGVVPVRPMIPLVP